MNFIARGAAAPCPAFEAGWINASPRLRVLHIEDDPVDARIVDRLARALGRYHLDITRVESIAEARAAISLEIFDLCVVDFWLGDEPSWKFLSRLDNSTPAILLTCVDDAETIRNCIDAGAATFVKKANLSVSAFEQAIDRALLARARV